MKPSIGTGGVLKSPIFDHRLVREAYSFSDLPRSEGVDQSSVLSGGTYETRRCLECHRTFLVVDFLSWRLRGYCSEDHLLMNHSLEAPDDNTP
jgi:hypothetical protein